MSTTERKNWEGTKLISLTTLSKAMIKAINQHVMLIVECAFGHRTSDAYKIHILPLFSPIFRMNELFVGTKINKKISNYAGVLKRNQLFFTRNMCHLL